MIAPNRYYLRLAAALVRGRAGDRLSPSLRSTPLDALDFAQLDEIHLRGEQVGLDLRRFRLPFQLPATDWVLQLLRDVRPAHLLDIGSGSTFLWPLLEAMPNLPVLAVDTDRARVAELKAIHRGGWSRLRARHADVLATGLTAASFEVVTALGVLRRVVAVEDFVLELARLARRFIVVSVPAEPRDRSVGIRLHGQSGLSAMFAQAGIENILFAEVPGHLIAVARREPARRASA